tara:strand:- start:245 stop:718 length:474 start_codon:yes stop_codon:yes gene_type:complete
MNFIAKVNNGEIIPEEPLVVNDKLKEFHEKEVEISIKKTNSRSNPQNRYYWGVIVHMIKERFQELGYTKTDIRDANVSTPLTREDVHLFLRDQFLKDDLISKDGEVIGTLSQSTKNLSTDEFVKFLDNVRDWAVMSLDINIPDPGIKILYNIELKNK